ncbi:MAG TPA: HdeD family acid-resistance protein [Methyloceanibacter sp.]|nr:HdeD family acid-resistance protein [Methyloceanibacter sp.]
MAIPMDAAAAALREAMRETVKRYSLWYLIQGILLVVAGVLALIYPFIASVAVVFLLAWILIISGVLQGIGLIGASNVPHYWLQLISAVLAILIGVLLLRSPDSGLLIMTVLLIVYFMVEGIAKVIFALTIRPFPNWGWVLGSGMVGILLALILWANMPLTSDWVLGLMLGILLVCEGAALTYLAWHVRTAPPVGGVAH